MGSKNNKGLQDIPQAGFFGHPKGLLTLFFTEFWERFSYYGMRAILLFYMYYEISEGGLGLNITTATSIMAIYGSLIYMSGVIGGWIADRLIGTSQTVFYGGILIMLGHIALAIPADGMSMLLISIALIVIGTGLLKTNVSTVVGDLYSMEDKRRDSGFNIFYTGINIGALIAPIVVGTLGQKYNFHLGFGVAAIGMFIGLVMFIVTRPKYMGSVGRNVPNPLTNEEKGKVFKTIFVSAIIIAALVSAGVKFGLLTVDIFTILVSVLAVILPVIYFTIMFRSPKTSKEERARLATYIPLFIAAVIFFAILEQGSIILARFADQRTQLSFAGFELQSSWFQSLGAFFIVIFAPIFAWLWMKLRDRQFSTTRKFSLGLFFAGFSYLILMLPGLMKGTEVLASPLWLVFSFFLISIGELFISPIGLSATTKLAPAAFASQTMSLWFLANAAGQGINAQIVRLFTPDTEVLYFGVIGLLSLILGFILYVISPKIRHLVEAKNNAA